MKLIRFGELRNARPGILTDAGERLDLSAHFRDWDCDFLGGEGMSRLQILLISQGLDLPRVPKDVPRGAPIARPGKIICIGLSYSDHARETGAAVPAEPTVFVKAPNTVFGPFDDVQIPRTGEKTDWEVELGVVIGRQARYFANKDDAREHIAGYVLNHDASERVFPWERGGQWTKGKSYETFNPLGTFVLAPDALPDPPNLPMQMSVNGEQRQNGDTNTMIFDVYHPAHYLSQFMTLEPGDLISTGTPPGVGMGMKPPQYLKPGDKVEQEIEELGMQGQLCISA